VPLIFVNLSLVVGIMQLLVMKLSVLSAPSSSLFLRSMVVLFCFDLYDRDCSNVLEAAEIAKMLRDLYGRNFDKNKRALKSVAFPFLLPPSLSAPPPPHSPLDSTTTLSMEHIKLLHQQNFVNLQKTIQHYFSQRLKCKD
jgi:hypothetical protein